MGGAFLERGDLGGGGWADEVVALGVELRLKQHVLGFLLGGGLARVNEAFEGLDAKLHLEGLSGAFCLLFHGTCDGGASALSLDFAPCVRPRCRVGLQHRVYDLHNFGVKSGVVEDALVDVAHVLASCLGGLFDGYRGRLVV